MEKNADFQYMHIILNAPFELDDLGKVGMNNILAYGKKGALGKKA